MAVARRAKVFLADLEELPMRILLANPRGFCAGSTWPSRAWRRALQFSGPGLRLPRDRPQQARRRAIPPHGARLRRDAAQVPEGSTLLYSAHGVSPADPRRQAASARLCAIDATCPLVTKVHLEAVKYARGATPSS